MRCPACDHENPEVARYCAACGAHLAATCPHCHAAIGFGARFCTTCGREIARPGAADGEGEPDAPPAPERRRVSVLFVDLENFTALAESLDPEEVRTIQSRYFEVARSIVARYGGTIEKFIGDAVMAVWGAPAAHEDDAERAVRAAVALVDAVGRLGGAATGTSLGARAAVTSGEAAVTLEVTDQGMVAGDLVNAAARLQSEAPLGGVLVDGATHDKAAAAAVFEPVGALSLRGRSSPLAAFRVSGAAPQPGGRHGTHTGPFVGRDRELRELMDLYAAVKRDGRSRLVSVTGIAGIGKSRLAWEFQSAVDAIPEPTFWHAGRAPAYGDDVTFAAVADMVRRRIRIDDVAEPQLAMRQLAAALREFVADPDERRWLEPRIAVLLGREAPTAYDREELFAAWRRFFERVSDRAPAVLVFEDLQWADPSLLDFIEHLATWSRDHPILIVTLARPELTDRRPGWGVSLRSFTALHLERLPDSEMRQLLRARAVELPDGLVRQILEHAGGVPLYAVEVVRILADRAPDAATPERRSAPRPIGARRPSTIDVPDSLHGLIAARIDALPRPERRLLLAAGVLGRRFRPGALVAVAGGDSGATRERMESLVRRELLTVDDELGSPGKGELGFVQDLVREVAYHTLARSERRDLHLAAARYLGSLDDENLAESLAGHLVEAHELAPDHPDATRIARRAVAALRAAARDAIGLHVPERAVGHLERALRLAPEGVERARLLEEAGEAARAAGRLDIAEGHLRELVALRAESGPAEEVARARAQLASLLLIGQQNEPALVELETALRSIRDIGSDASGVELASQLARARMLIGDDRGGLEWAERALGWAQRLELEATATDLLVTRGTARFRLGDEGAGLEDLRRAIEVAETAGLLNTELRARNNLAWLVVADDPRATLEAARSGFELASTMGVRDMAVQLADVACAAALDTGDWDWALETAADLEQRGIPAAFRVDLASLGGVIRALRGHPEPMAATDTMLGELAGMDPQVLAGVAHARAWVSLVSGAFEEARTLATQAAEESFAVERAHQLRLAARASLWLRDADGARVVLRALDAVGVSGRATDAARATIEAGIAALDGDQAAQARYRAAAQAWRELNLPLQLVLCLLDAQRLGGGTPSDPAECDAILRELGADGLARLAVGAGESVAVSPRSAPPPPARSRRPTARTASRSDAGRRRRRATDPPAPPG